MAAAAINAALWVVGKALSPIKDGLLEAWAATTGLAPNIRELKLELLVAEGMLDNARGRQPCSPALGMLLHELRQLAYGAGDVLDELDYFRIQDALDGTHNAADAHGRGCVHGLVRDACYTAKAVGKRFSCCSLPCAQDDSHSGVSEKEPPKLKFDRVGISERMKDIIDKLKPVCAKVSTVLNAELLASNPTTQHNTMAQPRTTTPYIIEPTLYGRDTQKKSIVEHIIHGEYSENKLITVLPIVGVGGIGKTTFTQHVYQEVKSHFDVAVWLCASQSFNAASLAQEAVKQIPRSKDEKEGSSDQYLIEQRLKAMRFLLVLDDVWTHHEDEWKTLLAPFFFLI